MMWTMERPTKPGIYWKKPVLSGAPFLVRVEMTPHTASGISATLCDRTFLCDLNCWADSEWAGPLEPPQ